MKFLVVLALFAAVSAEPEADANPYLYYTHGVHHPYNYGYRYPYVYKPVVAAPVVAKAAEPVEKAVEPVAEKKPVVYTYPHVYGAYGAYPYAHYNYAAGLVKPYQYYANSGGAVHVVKREAEAEADPEAWYSYSGYSPYAYRNYGYRYAPYTYGYAGYPYARYGGYARYHGYAGYAWGK